LGAPQVPYFGGGSLDRNKGCIDAILVGLWWHLFLFLDEITSEKYAAGLVLADYSNLEITSLTKIKKKTPLVSVAVVPIGTLVLVGLITAVLVRQRQRGRGDYLELDESATVTSDGSDGGLA